MCYLKEINVIRIDGSHYKCYYLAKLAISSRNAYDICSTLAQIDPLFIGHIHRNKY